MDREPFANARDRRVAALECASEVMAGWLDESSSMLLNTDDIVRYTLRVAVDFEKYINGGVS